MIKNNKFRFDSKKNRTTRLLITYFISGVLIVAFFAIYENHDIEQNKLAFARYQFNVQAAQINRSLELQESSEKIRLFEILMNSRLIDTVTTELIDVPNEVSDSAKDLALELIKRFNVNIDCTPLWLCDNKDKENAKTTKNSSTSECQCQNRPSDTPNMGNNNRENIDFLRTYGYTPTVARS